MNDLSAMRGDQVKEYDYEESGTKVVGRTV